MSKSLKSILVSSALAGLMAGSLAACGGAEVKTGDGAGTTTSTEPAKTVAPKADEHEADATHGDQAATPAAHDCKGKNACKGQGGCKVEGQNECKGNNPCSGKGGCKTA